MALITGTDAGETLTGTAGDDTIIGGRGNDVLLGGAGNDVFVWNPGDGSDTIDGQAGFDTLQFNGANINEQINIFANGSHAEFARDVAAITMDLNSVERIEFKALGGADTITIGDLTGTAVKQIAIDLGGFSGGGDGASDTVVAFASSADNHIAVTQSNGVVSVTGLPETLTVANAEAGSDALTIHGQDGNDTFNISMAAADAMRLSIDGGLGTDTLQLAGGAGADIFQVFANGEHAGISDTSGSLIDVDGTEHIVLLGSGGADTFVIGDLTGTAVGAVTVDLGADTSVDSVLDNANAGNDTIKIASTPTEITVSGLAAETVIDHAGKADILTINGLAGDDTIDASGLAAGRIELLLNGGDGNDFITGSTGDDFISGGRGNDLLFGGAGNDHFSWNPGDGSDTIDGGTGFDTLQFNGANINEQINIFANGSHAEFTRDVAAITMDLSGIERIEFKALGGADTIHVQDLSGTDVKQVAIDLGGSAGGGDGAADTVIADGSAAGNHIAVTQANGTISVTGLPETLTITNAEDSDSLVIHGQGGNDVINASALGPDVVQLTIDGGAGNDIITSGAGNDTITGGAGADKFNVTSVLNGHDVITDFTGGQDTLNLSQLFDGLGVADADRAGRVAIIDNGNGAVDVAIDADGNALNGFELTVATLHTFDHITVGHDVVVTG